MRGRSGTKGGRSPSVQRIAEPPTRRPLSLWLWFAIVAVVTVAAYLPVLITPTSLLWDDAGHVTSPGMQSLDGLWRIWTKVGATQRSYPVTHTAFWLQAQLWGSSLGGYHLVNVLLHACSATLLIGILRRLAVPGAVIAGVLFALHPVQAESVAWISELKNTLSGAFFFGAALAYICYDDTRSRAAYVTAFVLFSLAVLSKSVTATLPVGLAVVLWHRHGRVNWRGDILPLVPFLVTAIAGGALTVWFEHALIGAQGSDFHAGFLERTLIAGRAIWFYATSLAWPVHLSFNYPRWTIDAGILWQFLFPAGVLVFLGVAWIRRWRGVLTGVLVYCVMLAPALGFVNVYPFRFSFVADHFQYHAAAALLALCAAGITVSITRMGLGRPGVAAATVAIGLALAAGTRAQAFHYVDEPTLYRATIESNPDSWLAHNNLAGLLLSASSPQPALAAEHAREALRIRPDHLEARYNLGVALEATNQCAAAIVEFRRILSAASSDTVTPERLARTHQRLGVCLKTVGRADEAVVELERAIQLRPRDAALHAELGMAHAEARRPDRALPHFVRAAALDPGSAQHQTNLGTALLQVGRPADAIATLATATALNPGMADAFYNLGLALSSAGRYPEAAAAYREALRVRPSDGQTERALAAVLARIK